MLRKLFAVIVIIALSAAFLDVAIDIPLSAKRSLHLGIFDILLIVGAGMVVVFPSIRGVSLQKFNLRVIRMCWPGLVLVCVCVVSAIYSMGTNSDYGISKVLVGKTIFQYFEYLVLAPAVFLPFLESYKYPRMRVYWLHMLFFVAVFGYALLDTPMYPAVLEICLLALVLYGNLYIHKPVFAAFGKKKFLPLKLREIDLINEPGIFAVVIAALSSLWLLLGMVFSAFVVSRIRRNHYWILLLLAAIVTVTITFYVSTERYNKFFNTIQTYREYQPQGAMFASTVPTMRYYRWYGNLNMLRANPVLGVGPGAYNKALKNSYGTLDVPEGRTDLPELQDLQAHEPYTFSAYGVIGAETGFVGLLALLLLLGELLARGIRRPQNFGAGIAGAAVLLIIACLWTNPFVRLCGPMVGLLFAFSAMGEHVRDESDEDLPVSE